MNVLSVPSRVCPALAESWVGELSFWQPFRHVNCQTSVLLQQRIAAMFHPAHSVGDVWHHSSDKEVGEDKVGEKQ